MQPSLAPFFDPCRSAKVRRIDKGDQLEMYIREIFVFTLLVGVSVFGGICRKKTGVSSASLRRFKSGDFEVDDRKLNCYLECFMIQNRILEKNGEIDVAKTVRRLPRRLQEKSRRILEGCKDYQGKDTCDRAFAIASCFFKPQPELLKRVVFV